MEAVTKSDRRKASAQGFRIGRSLFAKIPAPVAVIGSGCAVLLTAVADSLSPPTIWFGPMYLLTIAFAAWFVGTRAAIMLGLLIISINHLAGQQSPFSDSGNLFLLNFGLRVVCVLIVVLLLGMARRLLENEWLLARTDPLTGALNRQAFFEAVKADCGHGGCTLLIFADLDGLKCMNDEMGHETGDAALRDFAGRVRGAIRKHDLFARIGGDEFVMIFKVTNQAAADVVINRLNTKLNRDAAGLPGKLTCSLGAMVLPAGLQSIDDELRAADKLMYAAKRRKSGFQMALAVHDNGRLTLSPALPMAADRGRKTVLRSQSAEAKRETVPAHAALGELLTT